MSDIDTLKEYGGYSNEQDKDYNFINILRDTTLAGLLTKFLITNAENLRAPLSEIKQGKKKSVKPSSDEQETIDALLKAGFDPNDLAALMGNIGVETRYTFDHTKKQDNGGGYGLFQFTDTHKDDYFDWIKDNSMTDSKLSQAKFVYDNIYERGGYGRDLGWRDRGLLQSAFDDLVPTPMAFSPGGRERVLTNKKTKTFLDSYEKSGTPHLDRRIKEAYKYHDLINQGMFKL